MITKRIAAVAAAVTTCAVAASVIGLAAVGGLGAATNLSLAPATVTSAQMTAVLAQHNTARSAVGVAPLAWSAGLAADAQGWADHLAATGGALVHADRNATGEGENLAKWSDPTSSPSQGVDLWLQEKGAYDASSKKSDFNDTTNPAWRTYGHYTQMVWSGTSNLGCGTASGSFGLITVCRYTAPGNVAGQLAYQPGGGTKPIPTPGPTATVNPAACAYNPGGRGGYGSYVDGLALDVRDWELSLTNAINDYRAQHGVARLSYSRTLARPAMWASLDDFNRGHNTSNHVDSRGMGVAQRVQYCSGYTGKVSEVTYGNTTIAGSTWQSAFAFFKANASSYLLDPSYTTWSGAQMAYGNNDTQRTPAFYTIVLGNH